MLFCRSYLLFYIFAFKTGCSTFLFNVFAFKTGIVVYLRVKKSLNASKSSEHRPQTGGGMSKRLLHYFRVCVCLLHVCVCVIIKLHITAQSGPTILVIQCHSR